MSFNEVNIPHYDIHHREQFDQILTLAKDEDLKIDKVRFLRMTNNRENWFFSICDYDNLMTEKQFVTLVEDIHERLSHLYYDASATVDIVTDNGAIEVKNEYRGNSGTCRNVKIHRRQGCYEYYMANFIVELDQTLNEATTQEAQEIDQILNIARDEGYQVTFQPKGTGTITSAYLKIFITEGDDSKEFYQTMCNIYDRLYNLDYINHERYQLRTNNDSLYYYGHKTSAFFMDNSISTSKTAYFKDNTHAPFSDDYESFFVYLK